MGKGRRNENRLVNLINRETPKYIDATANGYSGSHATCQSDLIVRSPTLDHAIEAKNYGWSTGQRKTLADEDDLEDLADSVNGYTRSWLVIDFSNRELLAVGPLVERTVEAVGERLVEEIPDAFEPSFTDGNNIRGVKPDTSEWPSKQGGRSDIDVLIEEMVLTLPPDGVATQEA